MSLRTRLLYGFAVTAVVLVAALWFVVDRQHDYELSQIDAELAQAAPLVLAPPEEFGTVTPPVPAPIEAPISDLYIGVVFPDGTAIDIVRGRLLDGAPRLSAAQIDQLGVPPEPSGDDQGVLLTAGSFRVLATPSGDGGWLLTARSTDEADAAVRRLLWTLVAVAVVVLATLALIIGWVIRLGLRPIQSMTTTATAISAGARNQRVPLDGNPTEVGALARALNEMLDQRDESDRRLRQFVADASHELRTPLTSIRGYLDLIDNPAIEADRVNDALRRVRGESRRMHDLIEQLLQLAQLDEGRPLQRTPVDVVTLAADSISDAQARQPTRPMRLIAPSSPVVVYADELRLQQVVAGLLDNALAHTAPEVAVEVSVEIAAEVAAEVAAGVSAGVARGPADDTTAVDDGAAHGSQRVVITVADHGEGLDAAIAARVFDRFTRGDASRSRHTGGSGLGLAIAQAIAAAHGGTLRLDTAPGEGCRFILTLPANPTAAERSLSDVGPTSP